MQLVRATQWLRLVKLGGSLLAAAIAAIALLGWRASAYDATLVKRVEYNQHVTQEMTREAEHKASRIKLDLILGQLIENARSAGTRIVVPRDFEVVPFR